MKIVYDMPEKDYRDSVELSKSDLDLIHVDPSLYDWVRSCPIVEDDPALKFGSLFHEFILTPEVFNSKYVIELDTTHMLDTITDIKRVLDAKGVEYKKSARKEDLIELVRCYIPDVRVKSDEEAQYKAMYGDAIISRADIKKMEAMRKSIEAHPIACDLFKNGQAEVSVFTDLFKCRCDYLRDGVIIDLKTTSDFNNIVKNVIKYRYHVQAGFYKHIVKEVTGFNHEFIFVFVSKNLECGRYPVQVFRLPVEVEEQGLEIALKDVRTFMAYKEEPFISTLQGFGGWQ